MATSDVIIRIRLGEDYVDVDASLVAEDFLRTGESGAWDYSVEEGFPSAAGKPEPVVHVKSGTPYIVWFRDAIDATNSRTGTKVVVYAGTDGQVYVRDADEFNDGRFQPCWAGSL